MPKDPFNDNGETSFESGISLKKPVQAVSDAAKQQAKAVTNDIVAQLYGIKDTSTNDPKDPNNPQKPVQPQPQPKAKPHILSGMSNAGDHAKFIARQQYMDKGDVKGAENAMFHLQHYFDSSVMTLEDRVKKNRQEQEQKQQQRKQEHEQEEQQKKEAEARDKEELPQMGATGKGRNRMGKKPKTSIALKMSQTKAEINRGATG